MEGDDSAPFRDEREPPTPLPGDDETPRRDASRAVGDGDPPAPDLDAFVHACRTAIHESNNALTTVIQECELAAMSDDATRSKRALERILDQAEAIARINRELRAAIDRFPAGR